MQAITRRTVLPALLLCVAVVCPATQASAQYFGRNKVQYKTLDFQILKTDSFDIYYYPEERDGIDIAARLAERWRARLQRVLSHSLTGRQPLILYSSHVDFEQTNAIQGELSEGTGGVTESLRRRIILPMGGPLADTDHVIGHELVHAFQFDMTRSAQSNPGENGAQRLPLWFIEGMAEYLSLGAVDPNTAMWLRDAARHEKLPSIDDLDNPKYFPYRWGQAFWAYVAGRWGDEVISRMLVVEAAGHGTDEAIERVLGLKTKELSDDWHRAIQAAYGPIISATIAPAESGTLIIKGQKLGGDLNVGPAISPDGRWTAFLSERSLFSIDLFIAETATGKVVHRLTSTASDPHYSSIQFIYSAGAWDAASRQIAIATVTSGKPALAIFDAQSGKRVREVAVPGVDEVLNPTWAPDGSAICFTGMNRGLTDLFVVDLKTGMVRALTHDAYADLQPAWSPDGHRIVFASDRFTTRLDTLAIGDYRLALVDPANGRIEEAGGVASGKNMTPQWSSDGQTLFFVADRNGIPNLFRMPIGGTAVPITNLTTGVSGITSTSPAMSVAARTNLAAFSVYDDGKYDIYARALSDSGGAGPATNGVPGAASPAPSAAALPPLERRPSTVQGLLKDAGFGLPQLAATYDSVDYTADLHLDVFGQPTVGVGVDRFGTSVGGGLSALFSDTLGDHSLGLGVQLNSGMGGNFSPKDTAAQASYLNQAHRWNWGLLGGQVPYVSGGFQQGIATVDGTELLIEQSIIFRQTERTATGLVAYPFNRARRVEFQGGVTQVSFDQIVHTQGYGLDTGQLLLDQQESTSIARPLSLATSSAAFVSDTSSFGAVSPVQGERYRFEATPSFGAINYTGVLVDYRRYVMPASFYTLAGRVLHYGRYGSGGEDQRLFPLYLGYPSLVRGYDAQSFDIADCGALAGNECLSIDRLTGSRVLVGNLEFRFPLLRPFTGPSPSMYGPVPVEVALFADGGVAWNRGERPALLGGQRDGIGSAGLAFRANLFGFAIGEFDFARPLQHGSNGWVFQFNLSPGF